MCGKIFQIDNVVNFDVFKTHWILSALYSVEIILLQLVGFPLLTKTLTL